MQAHSNQSCLSSVNARLLQSSLFFSTCVLAPSLNSIGCYAGLHCREIVTGKPLPLLSSFKLSYYTLLNLMRRMENSGQNMEYVIQHSFQQYQFERTLPDKQVLAELLLHSDCILNT